MFNKKQTKSNVYFQIYKNKYANARHNFAWAFQQNNENHTININGQEYETELYLEWSLQDLKGMKAMLEKAIKDITSK